MAYGNDVNVPAVRTLEIPASIGDLTQAVTALEQVAAELGARLEPVKSRPGGLVGGQASEKAPEPCEVAGGILSQAARVRHITACLSDDLSRLEV